MRAVAAVLMAALAPVTAAAQLYPVAGVLTNSVTGEPVAGATMSLSGVSTRDMIRSAQTDAEGRFALAPVAAGKYSLRAARRGYLAEEFNEHGGYSSAIVTGEGQDTQHIAFHLDPGAAVRCAVTSDGGEPVEGATVLLARKVNDMGLGEHLEPAGTGQTDDRGLFEFWGLAPGTYFLAVKSEPWFAIHIPRAQQDRMDEETRAAMAAMDVAYPVTYYDGAVDESAATPITVKSGEQVEAGIALNAVPALHLSIPALAGQTGGRQGPRATLQQTILGNEQFGMPFSLKRVNGRADEVEFDGVAPGHYTIVEGNPARETEIDATGSQQLDLSAGAPMFEVTIKARMADGSPLPKPLGLSLFSGNMTRSHGGQTDEKGEVRVQGVSAGEWNVAVEGGGSAVEVISIQTGTGRRVR